jgi:hypothetical protein
VVGSESKQVRRAKDAQGKRLFRERRTKLEPADFQANRVEIAAAAIVDWHGWEAGGQPLPCTPENARGLLAAEHILTQVEEAVHRHADFLPGAAG